MNNKPILPIALIALLSSCQPSSDVGQTQTQTNNSLGQISDTQTDTSAVTDTESQTDSNTNTETNSSVDTQTQTIINNPVNMPPTASITAAITAAQAPAQLSFFSNVSDSDGSVVNYTWRVDGMVVSTQPNFSHTFSQARNYELSLIVADNDGANSVAAIQQIIISSTPPINQKPVAVITADILSGDAPLTVSFTADQSMDDLNDIKSYQWKINNQLESSNISFTKVFDSAAKYNVTLMVTDGEGNESTVVTKLIDVTAAVDTAPTANFEITGNELDVDVNAANSTDLESPNALKYSWNFNNEHEILNSTSATANYTFANGGMKNITLTVTDPSGNTDDITQSYDAVEPVSEYDQLLNTLAANVLAKHCIECHAADSGKPIRFAGSSPQDLEAGITNYILARNPANVNRVKYTPSESNGYTHPGGHIIYSSVPAWEQLVDMIAANNPPADVPDGDESYILNSSRANFDVYDIQNCGKNQVMKSGNRFVVNGNGVRFGGWSSPNDNSTDKSAFIGYLRSADFSVYNMANDYNGFADDCNNVRTLNDILLKKFNMWGNQHPTGIQLWINDNKMRMADIDTVVVDMRINSALTVLPTMQEIKNTYAGILTSAQVEDMDDSEYHANLILNLGRNPGENEGENQALVDLHFTRNDLDKWMRVRIPIEKFRTYYTLNYQDQSRSLAQLANLTVGVVTFMGETKTRKVAQNYGVNNIESIPKLFKEMPIEIKSIELSRQENDFVNEL
ncbi:PKD domain-containing protein [Marinicellulosiphila megalodicopiae]|uniref:PKD domain-containing protein n=1 Tax=Marinicellulosiphila megalodicopiae TaxID=2724896 RepID=UPI003BB1C1F2